MLAVGLGRRLVECIQMFQGGMLGRLLGSACGFDVAFLNPKP